MLTNENLISTVFFEAAKAVVDNAVLISDRSFAIRDTDMAALQTAVRLAERKLSRGKKKVLTIVRLPLS